MYYKAKNRGISFPVAIIPTVRIIGNWRVVNKNNRWEINLFVRKALQRNTKYVSFSMSYAKRSLSGTHGPALGNLWQNAKE